ncbi:threonyl-tRNA synthetase [Halogranum rubrum]|uniref:Threonine--tRNA ligase n=1 Tax=Halogranum rubrum TaxID=553466 RepID=A0A1I4E138_9EURY|nr:threonine--tRNA ligase [Halogranum rubrum]SFK98730.1 threonyl-tRNA synthetase [Halogranum rubrum]
MSDDDSSQLVVTLPDNSQRQFASGTTVLDVAYAIGPGLGDDTVAGLVDGELVDKATPLDADARVEIVTRDSDAYLRVLRHSTAHVFAQALQRLHPEARLAIGPPTDDGFYYDVANDDLDTDDLADIEAEMADIVAEDLPIERVLVDREEALARYADNPFKREILEQEAAGESPVSFYEQGEFGDLCKGPHVSSTGDIGAFELRNISAAYWRGDETNETLTRVSGTAFESEAELRTFLERQAEAERRDHRRLGRELDLFSIPEHSPGCAHFHPRGMAVRRVLEETIREQNARLGYEEVWTPTLNRAELWKPSGHYDAFREAGEMFVWEQDGEEYGLKPMNCANHAYLYGRTQHSYRDLPIRFAEFGEIYRNEQSGELSGLFRLRGLTQDDGHAFVRRDQLEDEVRRVLRSIEALYDQFGLDVLYKLETKGDDAVGSDEVWELATTSLRDALDAEGLPYDVADGEAAFYGPKIGLDARDALGREWTIGTVQVDFNIPERLDLTYVGEDNEAHRPVMVHRALLGSLDRFMGVLIEHCAGKFPPWLAPEQVRILPVSDDHLDYARRVADELGEFRVDVETREWTVGRKIRQAHDDRIPYMLVVGDREATSETVSVRDWDERERSDVAVAAFREELRKECAEKRGRPACAEGE